MVDMTTLEPAALSGELSQVALWDVLQTVQGHPKPGRIDVFAGEDGEHATLHFASSSIVAASCGARRGDAALYRALSITEGRFEVRFDRTIEATMRIPIAAAVLEGVGRVDECARLRAALPDEDQALKLVDGLPSGIKPKQAAVAALFGVARSVEEAVLQSSMDELELLEIVRHLLTDGVIDARARDTLITAPSYDEIDTFTPVERHKQQPSAEPIIPTLVPPPPPTMFGLLRDRRVQGGAVAVVAVALITTAAMTVFDGEDSERLQSSEWVPSAERCPSGMAYIDGGRFYMGSNDENEELANAFPARPAKADGFCLDRVEVTVTAYTKCVASGGCESAAGESELCNGDNNAKHEHPINCVSWQQANNYCAYRGARLPQEVEWELAARGTQGRPYPWGGSPPTEKHINACGPECEKWQRKVGWLATDDEMTPMFSESDPHYGTAPVGAYRAGASPEGVQDLTGNVFEWTASPYEGDATRRVVKGGAFTSTSPHHTNPALRFVVKSDSAEDNIGFRCAANAIE